jgi:dTDP-glucose 4,6-dehydratase
MERIAIIGSNSFSGASFASYCLQQGLEVLGLSRSPEPVNCFLPYKWIKKSDQTNWRFVQTDLNTNIDVLTRELDLFTPTMVVNFAAQGMVAQSWHQPDHWYQTNVMANVRLHEILRRRNWLKKYVHVGTPEVYGSTSGIILEDTRFNPSTPYAVSRAACDMHLRTYYTNYGFPVVWTRAANVYGPGQQLYRIIPRTILAIILGQKLPLHGGGNSIRSFIHINDVARATLNIARNAPPGECYHLSTDQFISIRDLVSKLCEILNADFESIVDIVSERPGKDTAYTLDSSKARSTFNWSPQMSLENGLSETVEWVRKYLSDLRQQPIDYIHKP